MKIDWSKIPSGFNYVAVDACGESCAYEEKPFIEFEGEDFWTATGSGDHIVLEEGVEGASSVFWKDSLRERPSDDSCPTEEQLLDPEWWKENQPKGYDFYIVSYIPEYPSDWHKVSEDGRFYEDRYGTAWSKDAELRGHIKVYKKPPTPEPALEVGKTYELKTGEGWAECKILAIIAGDVIVSYDNDTAWSWVSESAAEFRPNRLEAIIEASYDVVGAGFEQVLAELYEAGVIK